MTCEFNQEDVCIIEAVYNFKDDKQICKFKSKDDMCLAKESDLKEICPDCDNFDDKCSCEL